MKTKLLYIGIGILVGLAITLGAWKVLARSYTYQGSLINPPVPAADFTFNRPARPAVPIERPEGQSCIGLLRLYQLHRCLPDHDGPI